MLKIYDTNHNAIGHIVKYKDLKIEGDVTTGDRTLSFTYLARYHEICEEYYIEDQDDEYVIKEKSVSTDGFLQFVAALNLEELEAKPWSSFSITDSTIEDAAKLALAGSGWTVGECTVTKKRNAGILQTNTLGVIQKLCTAFMCDVSYDTKNKKVSFYEQIGQDKGTFFLTGLNLRRLQRRGSTYDYYTRIIPIGKNCNSCCNPHQESNNKERNGSSSAYRCQPLGSNKLSNNNCICHTVQLLKNISQKYRNSKIQQHFHGLSHSHICLHIQFSSIRKNIV